MRQVVKKLNKIEIVNMYLPKAPLVPAEALLYILLLSIEFESYSKNK